MEAQCRRCLLHELSKKSFASVYEYIAQIDPAVKTPEEAYHMRLQACRGCEAMVNGMCRHCGCFVEVRAAKVYNTCPGIPSRWRGEAAPKDI